MSCFLLMLRAIVAGTPPRNQSGSVAEYATDASIALLQLRSSLHDSVHTDDSGKTKHVAQHDDDDVETILRECPSDRKGKAILAILAGRAKYLKLTMPYYNRLLDDGVLTEVHVWHYKPAQALKQINEVDEEYIEKTLPKMLNVHVLHAEPGVDFIQRFYKHYEDLNDEDIFIKADDDIVHIQRLRRYIKYLRCAPLDGWVIPNIITNDMALHFQIYEDMCDHAVKQCVVDLFPGYSNRPEVYLDGGEDSNPLTSAQLESLGFLYGCVGSNCDHSETEGCRPAQSGPHRNCPSFASAWPCMKALHEDYLATPTKYLGSSVWTWRVPQVYNAHFFGSSGHFAKPLFHDYNGTGFQDEAFMTYTGPKSHHASTTLFMGAVVVHFASNWHRNAKAFIDADDDGNGLLAKYVALADKHME